MEIIINSKDSLFDAIDWLHDCSFGEEGLVYNEELKTLDITIDRTTWENKGNFRRKFIFPFIWRCELPVVKCLLHLENIQYCRIKSKDKTLKRHRINDVKEENDGFVIRCCEVLSIYFGVSGQPQGYLKDIGPSEKFVYYSVFALLDIFSR